MSEDCYILSDDNANATKIGTEDLSSPKKIKTCPEESTAIRSEEKDKFSAGSVNYSQKSDNASGSPCRSLSLSPEITSPTLDCQNTVVRLYIFLVQEFVENSHACMDVF